MGKIQLYSLATPNGQKVSVALEELIEQGAQLEYEPHTINIIKDDQFTPEFIKINPNSKIPAIVDEDGPKGRPFSVIESGAILLYLAEKYKKLLPDDPEKRSEAIQWLMFQMSGIGPNFGNFGQFFKYKRDQCDHPMPLKRFTDESRRLLGVLNKQLEGREYIADEYSIADIATFPWVACLDKFYNAAEEPMYLKRDFPNVVAWCERCSEKPASQRGMKVCPFS